jgi:hypothetical protein
MRLFGSMLTWGMAAQVGQMRHRDRSQPGILWFAEDPVLPLQNAARSRPAQALAGLVHLGQRFHFGRDVAAGKVVPLVCRDGNSSAGPFRRRSVHADVQSPASPPALQSPLALESAPTFRRILYWKRVQFAVFGITGYSAGIHINIEFGAHVRVQPQFMLGFAWG